MRRVLFELDRTPRIEFCGGRAFRGDENYILMSRTGLTYEVLILAPEDGLRRELLGGDLYLNQAQSPKHQRTVGGLLIGLDAYAKQHGGEALSSPLHVVLSQTDVVQPDVMYFAPDRLKTIGEDDVQGAPSIVVEVASPETADVDAGRKLETYAKFGVPEYWIVDPDSRMTIAHSEPHGGGYGDVIRRDDGVIEPLTLPDFRFSLDAFRSAS